MALFLIMSGAGGGWGRWAEECLAVSSLLAPLKEFTGFFFFRLAQLWGKMIGGT